MTDMERKTFCAALSRYGAQAQITMVFEEMAELQDVLCKFLRGRVDGDTLANIAEEIAVAQERTRWIPVTERLPEATDGDYVLACVTWKDTHIDYLDAVVMAFVSEDGLVDVEMDCVLDGVTHWMPLPEPPEVE